MTTLMCGAMSGVMLSLHLSFRAEVKGIGHWSLGLALVVVASLLSVARDILPAALALLGANAALLAGIGLTMVATRLFYGRSPGWRLFCLIWLCSVAGLAWWLLVTPYFEARVLIFSCAAACFYGAQLLLIARHGERHVSSYFFGLLMALQFVLMPVRGAMALLSGAAMVDLRGNSDLASLYLGVANFMALLLTVGFMMIAMRRLQNILEQRSTLDPLTQVLNRRGFAAAYEQERARRRGAARPMTLMCFDLDHFKLVNDRFGHATGDRVLVRVAREIRDALRESDHVARFGGEEFVVLLPDTVTERALGVAERIRSALHAESGELPPHTVSIGIACQQTAQETLESMLERADSALFRAKANGRDRIELSEGQWPRQA
ncbi:MAG: GGDEF domain-containing protein [Burkholderiaceae bacterium]|nr:GGDEF domain-containing protein [Burkholderiaceae bacterium]